MNSFVKVFSELIEQNSNIEVSFKIFRVDCQRSLIQVIAFLERFVGGRGICKFNALGKTIQTVNVVRI